MKNYFTLTERFILEILWEQALTFEEISEQTSLKNEVLLNTLHLLMIKKAVFCNNWTYAIDKNFLNANTYKINSYKWNIGEIKELVNSAIEYSIESENGNFKLQKAELSLEEIDIIKGHFFSIDKIINQSNKNHLNKNRIIFYWGHGDYKKIIQQALN